ncbi:MAG: hypothetical protein RLZZ293_76, partial [Pseudomonadota bacterium]
MNINLLATVDLGSNSFRLLIGKANEDGTIVPIDQIKATVRLASGLDDKNNLTKEAQLIALEVLTRFNERLANFKKSQVRVVGTSTLRVAINANDFITIANKALGFPIEVISGKEEARLIYIGAMHSLSYSHDKRLVVDIGGGSTEFIIGEGYEPQIMESVTMGCVSYTGRYFADGQLTEANFNNAIYAARSKIQSMEHLFSKHEWKIAIGTSGTAKTLYDMCLENNLANEITYDGMLQLKKMLIRSKTIKNIQLLGIKDERKEVIAGGLAIMLAIFEELAIKNMTIADGSLREGVMYDLIGRKSNADLRGVTVADLKKRYHLDELQGERVANLAAYLHNQLVGTEKTNFERRKLLIWACELYEIGLGISHNDYHKHGAYILQHSDLAGFSKPEQTIIAELVHAHRGSVAKVVTKLKRVVRNKLKTNEIFGLIAFRLSVIINRSRKELNIFDLLKIDNVSKNGFNLIVNQEWINDNPLTLFSLQ